MMAVAKRSGTRSTAKQIDFMKAVNDVGTPLAFIGGLALGNAAIKKLSKTRAISGLLGTNGAEKYLVPVGTAVVGLVLPQLYKHKLVRIAGYGIAASGLMKGIEEFTGKKVLNGFDGLFGNDWDDEMPTNAMRLAGGSQSLALPRVDMDIEAEIEKDLKGAAYEDDRDIEGSADQDPFIYSDDLGEVEDEDLDEEYY